MDQLTFEDVKSEHDRRNSKKANLLAYLIERGEATNIELEQVAGYRFSARLFELRKKGHKIATKKGKLGSCSYIYLGSPESE